MDRLARRVILAAGLAWAGAAMAQPAAVAWLQDGRVQGRSLDGEGRETALPERVPLGSLWKLFVHAYLVDRGAHEPAYRCTARPRRGPDEDDYCCEPGQAVERDEALVRSCGRYFEPGRLGIEAAAWRAYWLRRGAFGDAAWLAELGRLQPGSELAPAQLLAALAAIPSTVRGQMRDTLLAVLLQGYGRDAWPVLGTALRFKTYSWHDRQGAALGGGAGWLADGTPVWFGGPGASRNVLDRYAAALAAALPAAKADAEGGPCADVRFFARYPIQAVRGADGTEVASGPVPAPATVEFANGQRVSLKPGHGLDLSREQGRLAMRGRFALEDYVARVVDREGSGEPPQAARALAVAARSYLVQQGAVAGGCFAIDDDSRSQRVSPNAPSTAARAAATFSEGVVLQAKVRYHRDRAEPGVMAWQRAVELDRQGRRFDAILADAYGAAAFAGLGGASDCQRLADAESWLAARAPAWGRELRRHAGFEAPDAVTVCALGGGHPYSDQGRSRIYVRDWMSAQGRMALTHEYLHLAFRFHPDGADEAFVERTARGLNGVPNP